MKLRQSLAFLASLLLAAPAFAAAPDDGFVPLFPRDGVPAEWQVRSGFDVAKPPPPGAKWKVVTDWIAPMRDVIRPMVEASAAKYAKDNKITPRSCK